MIEKIAPRELAEPWDNPGLQLGAISREIKVIYFALDPVLNTVKKAAEHCSDLLITHHPLIFGSISRLETDVYPGNVIKEALKRNIAIISAHTNLDCAPDGLNSILAEMLKLKEVEILKEIPKAEGAGLGRIGDLSHKMVLKDLLDGIKKVFGLQNIRLICDSMHKPVKRVAIVGGSGGSLIPYAVQKKADVLITGDIGYHDALNALSHGIIIIDVGHFSTESHAYRIFGQRFGNMLRDKGFEVKVILDREGSDPFWIL